MCPPSNHDQFNVFRCFQYLVSDTERCMDRVIDLDNPDPTKQTYTEYVMFSTCHREQCKHLIPVFIQCSVVSYGPYIFTSTNKPVRSPDRKVNTPPSLRATVKGKLRKSSDLSNKFVAKLKAPLTSAAFLLSHDIHPVSSLCVCVCVCVCFLPSATEYPPNQPDSSRRYKDRRLWPGT